MTSPLLSTATLAAQLNDANLVVVDSRHDLMNPSVGRDAYAAGHIPGAIFMSIDDDLSTKKSGSNGRHPLPSPEVFAATLSAKGIGNASKVVVYDGGNAMYAGRLWWMLRWLGHTNVFALDGGFAQWQKEDRAVETQPNAHAPASFQATIHDSMRLSADDTLAAITDPNRRILDARALERYRGDVEPVDPVAGHIPGAVNRAFGLNQRDGLFKPADELKREFEAILAGRAPTQLIHQCGSGVSACANMLAMEHAGLAGSKLYAGSWSEWCSDASRPVATG
jgi:thiosulfate/3-mercaptopyruvate sulfurtransferase